MGASIAALASSPLEEEGVRTRDLAVAGPRSRDRNGGASSSSSSPAVGGIPARASIAASTPPPRVLLGIRSSLSSLSSSSSYLPPLREAVTLPPAFVVFLPFSVLFFLAGSLWSMPSPPGPVSNAGRSSTLDDDLALVFPRPPAELEGRRGSTALLRGTSSNPPHRVLRIVVAAPPLDATGSSTSRRSRPSRVILRPSPSYSGLSNAARAVDGRRRRAVDAVLGRVRSAARPPALPRESDSSSSRRFDLGVNASRVVVVVVARALGSIRRPL